MTKLLLAGLFAFGCVAPALAGETVTEHETYEKRSMTVEPAPLPERTERTVEETTETSRVDKPRQGTVVEKRTVERPGGVIEKRTETTTDDDD